MFLREIFNLIGFSKLQQITLIKILFLTGSLAFVEPNSFSDIKETVKINEEFLSSEISETLIFEKNYSIISQKKAQEILDVGEFESKEKAYHWINSILKRKFDLEKEKTLKELSSSKSEEKLLGLLNEFDSAQNFPDKQKFNHIIIIGDSACDLKNLLIFSNKFLKNNHISAQYFYLVSFENSKNLYKTSQKNTSLKKYFTTDSVDLIEIFGENNLIKDRFLEYARKSLQKISPHFSKKSSQSKILLISAADFPRYQLAIYKSIFPKETDFTIINFKTEKQKNIASTLENFSVELGLFEDLILRK